MKLKTSIVLGLLYVSGLVFCGVTAAQSRIPLPASQQLLIAPPAPRKSLVPVVPIAQPPSTDSGQNVLVIPVPKAFAGCWGGVRQGDPDSFDKSPEVHIGGWIPSEIRLCLRKPGDGPWQLTWSSVKLDVGYAAKHHTPISNIDTRVELVSGDGKNQVWLRRFTSVNEQTPFLWFFPGREITISEIADMHCTLIGAVMNIQGSDLAYFTGLPHVGKTP